MFHIESSQMSSQIRNSTGYYVDHAENCDVLEEDSVDRLWLVVRSLKNEHGNMV